MSLRARLARVCAGIALAALAGAASDGARAQISSVVDPAALRPGWLEVRIVNGATSRPLTTAMVRVLASRRVGRADEDGRVRLAGIRPGSRTLIITAEGMNTLRIVDLVVPAGRSLRLPELAMTPMNPDALHELSEVEIRADALHTTVSDHRFAPELVPLADVVVTPSHFSLGEAETARAETFTATDFLTLPHLGGDVYRAVDRLPGISSNDLSARFWVRGAPNQQVLTRLDGVELLEPFHLKDFDGALSLVDVQRLDRMDLYTGGFTAEFGDRLAGVLLMETRDPAHSTPGASLSATLTSTAAADLRSFGDGRWGSHVSGRFGYPGLLLRDRETGRQIDAGYGDMMAKLEYRPSEAHVLSFHLLHAFDALEVVDPEAPTLDSEYASTYAWLRWRAAPGPRFSAETVASYGLLERRHRGLGKFERQFDVDVSDERLSRVFDLRHDALYSFDDDWLVRTGFEAKFAKTGYDYHIVRQKPQPQTNQIDDIDYQVHTTRTTTYGAAYAALRLRPLPAWVLEPSLRFERHTHTNETVASPRLNPSYEAGRITVRGAWGVYHQAQGVHELPVADGMLRFDQAERAEHRMVGIEARLRGGLFAQVQAYQRISSRVRPRWTNLVNVDGVFPELVHDRRLIAPVRARSEGVELQLERRRAIGFSWSTRYAFSADREWVSGGRRSGPHSQPHALSADLSYAPSPRWRFSAAWQYHSGRPTTEVSFSRTQTSTGDVYTATLGEPYALRLPSYHRLDLRLARSFSVSNAEVTLFVDVFNAYNRQNVQGYRYAPLLQGNTVITLKTPLTHLSRMPNAGVTIAF